MNYKIKQRMLLLFGRAILALTLVIIQYAGSAQFKADRIKKLPPDSSSALIDYGKKNINPAGINYQAELTTVLAANEFINLKKPVWLVSKKRQAHGKEYLFYLLGFVILMFGLFRLFFDKYFNNIFRVFFNTSLRQNQLTDLLLQARLPSLIFNIFFAVTGGLYVWLLLPYYYSAAANYGNSILLFCIAGIAIIYFAKYCVLKFIGWITDMRPALNTYIFVIFLINKIAGIILIPFIIMLAFSPPQFIEPLIILSLVLIGVFFLLRFLRSYSLIQHELNLLRFHFTLYIVSLEVLPLIIIYKLLIRYLAGS